MDKCIHHEVCGGCLYQGVSYDEQLNIKENTVNELLIEKGVDYGEEVKISPAPRIYSYRNKMDYTFGDEIIDGPMTLGMHKRKKFMSVITVDHCQLVPDDFNKILSNTLKWANEKGYVHYHKKRHEGLLRHLIVRHGQNTGELLINMVTTSDEIFDEDGFVEMIRGLNLENEVVGVLRTIYDGIADFIYCDELKVLWGRDYYMETVLDMDFKVSAFSFFQTNTIAAERLYSHALKLIEENDNKTLFDVYCGTGTISLQASKVVKDVIGIEIVEEAVKAAEENAKINNIHNCRFIAGDALDVIKEIDIKPDMIILDPPRAGIHPKALKRLMEFDLDEIIYISCNPKTFANDMAIMQEHSYSLDYIKAYDNFPFTKHIELVTRIKKQGRA